MRILVVEDEHRIATSIQKGLSLENFAVDVAHDGTDGYDMASTEEYDCIVLDLMLPGMTGIEICKRLRNEKIHTPILILTAKGQIRDKVEGLDAGADDYLTKPFSFEELLARVRALTRRPKQTLSAALVFGDLKLDSKSHEVTRAGKLIELTAKEFGLLENLLRHAGHVCTKDDIIAHVWDYDANILPNTVEVYMKKLRKKVDDPFEKKLLKTVRGFGYKVG
ncbi:MAG TPA: response regulator transcription factor [Patescibacteria group bacterium]|nr:response regulator transcription factor [Patescibacteria group bacterium]